MSMPGGFRVRLGSLGVSHYPGSTRANDAARTMLANYAALYGNVRRAHLAIRSRLDHMSKAFGDTHQLYSELDAKHEAVFQRFLDEHAAAPEGGEHAAAGED